MTKPSSFLCKPKTSRQIQGICSTTQLYWWGPRLRWPNENQKRVSLMASFLNKVWPLDTIGNTNALSFNQGYSTLCLPSHLSSSSVRDAIHTSHMKRKSILCLILLPPTPSPLLSCLPSHLSSSSVRCAIHTSYMKRNSIVILFSSHPTPLSLSNHPPLVTTLWKENYKSAKCNIAFDRELKWFLALSPMI